MRADIHPKYAEAEVTCSCGSVFKTQSTGGDMHIELCNECHPFFTGRQKLVDTGGRVERFRRRYEGTELKSSAKAKAEATDEEVAEEPADADVPEEAAETTDEA